MAEQVVTELIIDGRQATVGADAYSAAMVKASVAANGLVAANDKIAASVEKQTVRMTAGTNAQAAQWARMAAAADPVVKAQQALEKATTSGQAAMAKGKITQDEFNGTLATYKTRVEEAGKSTGGFGLGIASLKENVAALAGGFGLIALVDELTKIPKAILDIVHETAGLEHTSEIVGVTTKNLQELQGAGQIFHISADTMTSALERFSKNLGLASEGTGALNKVLQLNHVQLSGDFTKDFLSVANLIQNASTQEQKNTLITQAFGRNAQEMGLFFKEGAVGVRAAMDEIDKIGGVINDETIKKMTDLDATWTKFTITLETRFKQAALGAAGVISHMADETARLSGLVTDFENNPSSQTFLDMMFGKPGMANTPPSIAGDTSPRTIADLQAALAAKAPSPATIMPSTGIASAEKLQKEFESLVASTEKQTSALSAQAATFGMTAVQADGYGKYLEMINAAAEKGIQFTPTRLAEINAEADAYARVTAELQRMKDAAQAQQFLAQSFFDAARGATSLSDALKKVAASIEDSVLQATLLGQGPLAGIFGTTSNSGGLLGSLFSFLQPAAAGGIAASPAQIAAATGYHAGGIVGVDGTPRYVHPAYFEGAPRYHLGIDEVPAILQRGERVLSRAQAAAGGSGAPSVTVNVTMQGGGSEADNRQAARAVGAMVESKVYEVLDREARIGGRLNRVG